MTMMSFRVGDEEAAETQAWADELGIDKSELLRDALHRHIVRLASQRDVSVWNQNPLTTAERSLAEIADWGAAEDWTDWDDATR